MTGCVPKWLCLAALDYMLTVLPSTPNPTILGVTKSLARTMKDQEMKGNDILDVCRRLNQITDKLPEWSMTKLSVTATLTMMARTVARSG